MAAKRKRPSSNVPQVSPASDLILPGGSRASRSRARGGAAGTGPPVKVEPSAETHFDTNPDKTNDVIDGKEALRASPDADDRGEAFDLVKSGAASRQSGNKKVKEEMGHEMDTMDVSPSGKSTKTKTKSSISAKKGSDEIKAFKAEQAAKKAAERTRGKDTGGDDDEMGGNDGDADGDEGPGKEEDVDTVKRAAARPPPVHSDYLPLPWKGRLGYACLNTYLRLSNPPIFTSRTCRIASILEHRHPLQDPSQPEHSTKNRPDKTKSADVARGQKYVQELCLANIRDIPKMLKWNEKYGIRFMRLSSEMFPFASHDTYGYKLAPFASEALAEAGKVATDLGHRLTTHPGQFTQLGSPRPEVIKNAIRDLEYHDEMLSLLKLSPQGNRDAIMVLHMGGTFGDKAATLDRFRENYKGLSQSIKNRLVLENDDVSWSVYDLLPICEELNIPLVLDFHHHNIIFDSDKLREGTKDIVTLFPRIKATWDRKNIRQKMHHSEQTSPAVTQRERRKHNPRPKTLPPCPDDMDLMIEAKDKEQAVFELMRTLKLPGWDSFNDIIPYERTDDNRPVIKVAQKKKTKKQIAAEIEEFGAELPVEETPEKEDVPEEEVGMGGEENRVYWPLGMEEWLRPKKREIKKKDAAEGEQEDIFAKPTPANFAARMEITKQRKAPLSEDLKAKLAATTTMGEAQAILEAAKPSAKEVEKNPSAEKQSGTPARKKARTAKSPASGKMVGGSAKKSGPASKKAGRQALTPSASDHTDDAEEDDDALSSVPELSDGDGDELAAGLPLRGSATRRSGRVGTTRKSYKEEPDED